MKIYSINERLRDYLHYSLDKVIDKLIAENLLEKSRMIYFDVQKAFHDIDHVNVDEEVKIEKVHVPDGTMNETREYQ